MPEMIYIRMQTCNMLKLWARTPVGGGMSINSKDRECSEMVQETLTLQKRVVHTDEGLGENVRYTT